MLLPKPPSLDVIHGHIPQIGSVPDGTQRPFWSVMIPTYNSGHYLRRTLESVLCQDPGPQAMQIEVVDGCSTKDNPERITRELGKGRVAFYRLPSNHGSSHTFNVAIQRARGHWVHILHGDDMVLPGFYDTYQHVIDAHCEAVMVVGGATVIDEQDRVLAEYPRKDVDNHGVIHNFAEQQGFRQMAFAAPSVVVRRSAYEAAGGFCSWFTHVNDMDMWLRIALEGSVAGIGRPHALWRRHANSATDDSMLSGANIRERVLLTLVNYKRMQFPGWHKKAANWKKEVADWALSCAWSADRAGSTRGRLNQAYWVFRLTPSLGSFWYLVKSFLKHRLFGSGPLRETERRRG